MADVATRKPNHGRQGDGIVPAQAAAERPQNTGPRCHVARSSSLCWLSARTLRGSTSAHMNPPTMPKLTVMSMRSVRVSRVHVRRCWWRMRRLSRPGISSSG